VSPKKSDKTVRGSLVHRSLAKILVFYALFISALVFLVIQFPWMQQAFTGARLQELAGSSNSEIMSTFGGSRAQGGGIYGWQNTPIAVFSLVSTLLIMIPTAWSYIIIKARTGYSQSVVHTLIILPLAVTGIILVVQASAALAFSLAGVVAAVRWRTTLDDPKDAVYVFMAIGVGLCTGAQALGVALSLSIVFNVVNLVLWKLNFGNMYVDQLGRTAAMGLGDALAGPESGASALQIGDRSLLTALSPREVREVAEHRERLESYLDSVSDTNKERKAYSILLVHTRDVGDVQLAVEAVLKRGAARWRLAEILPSEDGVSVLEYLVRVREGVPEGAILDAIRREGEGKVEAAELRSLEGLKKRSNKART
jgi:Domain of unknown function (DUF4956)